MTWLLLLMALFAPSVAEAACSGSGLTWTCPAGATVADVNSVVGSASDGATVTFSTGAYSWASSITLSNSKGITLICEAVQTCDVTAGAGFLVQLLFSGTNTKAYRISGFEWLSITNNFPIAFYGAGSGSCNNTTPCKLTNVRVDHNKFTSVPQDLIAILFGESSNVNISYGVVDHNTITGTGNAQLVFALSKYWNATPESSYAGTANALFIEDNTFTFTSLSPNSTGCVDTLGGHSIVFRHNTTLNCLVAAHGVPDSGGPWNFEAYANTFEMNYSDATFGNGYRLFHHQGAGQMTVYDNIFKSFSGHSSYGISLTHYRSATPGGAGYVGWSRCDGTDVVDGDGNRSGQLGYPCFRQPGRADDLTLMPIYVWNNYWFNDNSKVDLGVENPWAATNPSVGDHLQANRDYYNAVSASAQTTSSAPFDGTTGMGFGTLARRPLTCTTGAAADSGNGGVGYFATDEGKLYRCSATNTWTLHYTAYTYPHPLQGAAGGGSSGSALSGALTISGSVVLQ